MLFTGAHVAIFSEMLFTEYTYNVVTKSLQFCKKVSKQVDAMLSQILLSRKEISIHTE